MSIPIIVLLHLSKCRFAFLIHHYSLKWNETIQSNQEIKEMTIFTGQLLCTLLQTAGNEMTALNFVLLSVCLSLLCSVTHFDKHTLWRWFHTCVWILTAFSFPVQFCQKSLVRSVENFSWVHMFTCTSSYVSQPLQSVLEAERMYLLNYFCIRLSLQAATVLGYDRILTYQSHCFIVL